MPPVTPSFIQADALCFSRNEERIFGPLSFYVGSGEALLIKGDNGSGKTTLLRVLAGLLPAESGQLLLCGKKFERESFCQLAAYLGHKHGHKAELSVIQNLRCSAQLHGNTGDISLETLLAECGLAGYEDTPAGKLSAGQNKRLSLARLKTQDSALWLMDEPYANLDLAGIAWVNAIIQTHIQNGGAAIISSHGAYAAPEVPIRTLEIRRSLADV
jgi:heme exporter protein A